MWYKTARALDWPLEGVSDDHALSGDPFLLKSSPFPLWPQRQDAAASPVPRLSCLQYLELVLAWDIWGGRAGLRHSPALCSLPATAAGVTAEIPASWSFWGIHRWCSAWEEHGACARCGTGLQLKSGWCYGSLSLTSALNVFLWPCRPKGVWRER